MPEISVTRDDADSRYVIHQDGTLAGYTRFERRPGEIRFLHTELDPAFRGTGLAGRLAADALADAAASGDTIVPYCPFMSKYLRTHEVPGARVRLPRLGASRPASEQPGSEQPGSEQPGV